MIILEPGNYTTLFPDSDIFSNQTKIKKIFEPTNSEINLKINQTAVSFYCTIHKPEGESIQVKS